MEPWNDRHAISAKHRHGCGRDERVCESGAEQLYRWSDGAGASGGTIAFIWFNAHPAELFMGDAGSLPLGGVLGLVAVITKHELLLPLIAIVFVAEALSVMLQVAVFKLTKRRVLACAPLHHHFEFQGWAETKVVIRFWIAGGLAALAALATLAVRA